jgi:hypothetical protein
MEQITVRKLDHAVCRILVHPGAVLWHAGQWYNIFGICASDGRSRGRHCGVTRLTCIGSEDEFAALPLSPAEWQTASAGYQNLLFARGYINA